MKGLLKGQITFSGKATQPLLLLPNLLKGNLQGKKLLLQVVNSSLLEGSIFEGLHHPDRRQEIMVIDLLCKDGGNSWMCTHTA